MPQVGIFGDQLIPTGHEAQVERAKEQAELAAELAAAEAVEAPAAEVVEEDAPVEEPTFVEDVAVEEVEEAPEEVEETPEEESAEAAAESEGLPPVEHRTAHAIVSDIESAESVEDVDALAVEGEQFKTVQAAAEKRKEELAS